MIAQFDPSALMRAHLPAPAARMAVEFEPFVCTTFDALLTTAKLAERFMM